MQVEEITQILRESPSVRLIKSRSVDFFLSFVIEAFVWGTERNVY